MKDLGMANLVNALGLGQLGGSLEQQRQWQGPAPNPWLSQQQRQFEREKFYRSCSQGWLDAMLDIELGL